MSIQTNTSIFLVVRYSRFAIGNFSNVIEIDLTKRGCDPPPLEYVAKFIRQGDWIPQPIDWTFCSLATETCGTGLCLLPDSGPVIPDMGYDFPDSDSEYDQETRLVPLNGYIIDLRTRKVQKMKPSKAPKYIGHGVSFKEKIYFITDTFMAADLPDPSFERYDPINECWETLPPFPYTKDMGYKFEMLGYAVFDEFILFSIHGKGQWAYDESRNKWYVVAIDDNMWDYLSFRGQAVVVGTNLYALSLRSAILKLSITRVQKDGDVVFTCSLCSRFKLPGFQYLRPLELLGKDHLVHLGNQLFCLVQTGTCFTHDSRCHGHHHFHQRLQLAVLHLVEPGAEENAATLEDILDYVVDVPDNETFSVVHCFSDCEDIVSKLRSDHLEFTLDPIFEGPDVEAIKISQMRQLKSKYLADTIWSPEL